MIEGRATGETGRQRTGEDKRQRERERIEKVSWGKKNKSKGIVDDGAKTGAGSREGWVYKRSGGERHRGRDNGKGKEGNETGRRRSTCGYPCWSDIWKR